VIARAKSSLVLVGLLLILLPALAVLQYRWIGEVSAAERGRLESSLRVASERFAADFDAELSRLANAFQIRDGFPASAAPVVERYQTWVEANPYGQMVQGIYLLKTFGSATAEYYRVDLQEEEFEPAPMPAELENLRDRFRPGPMNFASGDRMMLITTILRAGRGFSGPRPEDFRQRGFNDFRRPDRGRQGATGAPGLMDGATVIELDRDVILKDLVPVLAAKHFSLHDETAYRIAIVGGREDLAKVLYSSAGEWKPEDIATPDAAVNLFGPPRPAGPGERGRGPGPRIGLQGAIISEPWQLQVKHRAGSLERAVEHTRDRNLAISFGILLILGAGLITVVISSQRAHTLGRLQMEFAAGVSHELRTPLTVIQSAAHNLRSGIVRDKEGVEQYAAIVQAEARRLSDMVEEVLLYSETQSGRKKYSLEPIDVNEVIDRAITSLSPAIDLEKSELRTRIDPDLPPVKADSAALVQCVLNLLSNAFKYGIRSDRAEIEIAAQQDPATKEVQLSVTDHGPGVDPADQRHLFEPFFRGSRAGSNVPGNGLGLHLVERIMQAQGGRVTFSPAPLGGASFTLHIPTAS
jgi:signal transduction histidine kinase